jgi:hypothetical protein
MYPETDTARFHDIADKSACRVASLRLRAAEVVAFDVVLDHCSDARPRRRERQRVPCAKIHHIEARTPAYSPLISAIMPVEC